MRFLNFPLSSDSFTQQSIKTMPRNHWHENHWTKDPALKLDPTKQSMDESWCYPVLLCLTEFFLSNLSVVFTKLKKSSTTLFVNLIKIKSRRKKRYTGSKEHEKYAISGDVLDDGVCCVRHVKLQHFSRIIRMTPIWKPAPIAQE